MGFHFDNLDAAENIFFERQLEQVRNKTYDIKYAALKARMLIPVDNSVDPGAETVKYEQFDEVGQAKIINSYADDLPRVDIKAKEFRQPIKSIGVGFGYSTQELRAAKFAGKPLEARRATTTRRAVEQTIDRIAATGDAANGLLGLLNQPNALVFAVPNNAGGTSAHWADKSPDEILADLNGIVNLIVSTTKEIEQPDTLLLPVDQYTLISSTPRSANSDTTILKYFLTNNPFIHAVEPWAKLSGVGSGSTDRMVAYRRDPDALQLIISMEFTQYPPQPKGLAFEIPCEARCGGVQVYYPLSICYGDGI